jgi:predicted transposase YdaD
MWEQDASLFLGNLALLPLAPLCQTASPRDLLAQVAIEVAKIADRSDRQNTAGYTEILAGLRFDSGLIRQLLSEDMMQESVIYQDILQKGAQKEAVRFLNRQLNRRFGTIDSAVVDRLKLLSTEELEVLGEEFFGFADVSALLAWLDAIS